MGTKVEQNANYEDCAHLFTLICVFVVLAALEFYSAVKV